MVEVCLPRPESNTLRVRVTGHAGSGPKGHDLVCAAVSALVFTMLGGLEKVAEAEITGTMRSGECDVEVRVPLEKIKDLMQVTELFRHGFQRLVETYPNLVQLVQRN